MDKLTKKAWTKQIDEIFDDNGIYLTESQDADVRLIKLLSKAYKAGLEEGKKDENA